MGTFSSNVMCGKFKNVFFILYVYIWSILYEGTSQWSYPISLIQTKQGKMGKWTGESLQRSRSGEINTQYHHPVPRPDFTG